MDCYAYSPPLPKPPAVDLGSIPWPWLIGLAALGGAAICLYYVVKKRWMSGVHQATAPPEGLEMARIEDLPTASYPPELRDEMELDPSCPICLEHLVEGEEVSVLPCHHFFHPHCIAYVLRPRARCPKCRSAFV